MIRSGEFVSDHVGVDDRAVQPHGVDLSIGEIYSHGTRGRLEDDAYIKPERIRVETTEIEGEQYYDLEPGAYVVEYDEIVEIPPDHAGLIFPRSRLMRCGGMLFSAVWDSGYCGKGEGGLWIQQPLEIQEGMRIGQIVLARTEELESYYDGSHQGENV